MYNLIIALLNAKKWHYQVEKENSSVLFGVSANYGNIDCYLNIDDEKGIFSCISFCHCFVFTDKYTEITEFITRANFGLISGNFEFDLDSGILRFKTTFYYDKKNEVSMKLLEKYIYTNLYTIDTYTPALMSLAYTDITALEAVAEVENNVRLYLN